MLLIDPPTCLGALLLALLVDAAIGDPAWLWRRIPHPVVVVGNLVARLDARWLHPGAPPAAQRRAGRNACLVVVALSALVALIVHLLITLFDHAWIVLGVVMSALIAGRDLHDHVRAVASGLERGLAEGRRAVAHIVGRDPDSLEEPGIARAAIESCAENFADGVVAPLFWGLVLGLPGMLVYKAINTADSMIGHRSPRHVHFGRFAARLDDAVNWLPARLCGVVLVAAATLLPGCDPGRGWRAMRRDAPHHRSPNAGWPEAAMAGSLGLRIAGPRRYAGEVVDDAWMGDGRAAATPADIRRALRLFLVANGLVFALIALALAALV